MMRTWSKLVTPLLSLSLVAVLGCGGKNNNTPPPDAAPAVDGAKAPQCSDTIDNDGDGKIDFPSDPGCIAPNADDETDSCPTGATCPQCADGKDNDGNGKIDYPADPGCASASDNDEFTENPLACGAGVTILQLSTTGSNTGMLNPNGSKLTSGLACPAVGAGSGSEAVYELRVNFPSVLTATTDTAATTIDSVLYLRGAMCSSAASEVVCNNDVSLTDFKSTITASLPAGVYYIVVDNDSAAAGNYELQVTLQAGEGGACALPADCGPGLLCHVPAGGTTKVCGKPACADGMDNDSDSKTDFPNDPGCVDTADDDETDTCPNGATCPQCGNGKDDDLDGKTDFPADPKCGSAGQATEAACALDTDGTMAWTTPTVTGTLVGAADDLTSSCLFSGGPDRTYWVNLPAMDSVSFDSSGSLAHLGVVLYDTSCATELSCNHNHPGGDVIMPSLAAGTYVVSIDAYDSVSLTAPYGGTYAMTISGTIAAGGSCESPLAQAGALVCSAGHACGGTVGSRTCVVSQCADGMDNDGDTKTDFPADPGCTSKEDNSEVDDCGVGNPVNCPVCANGKDDDGDTKTDFPADTSCLALGDDSEACTSTEPVVTITSPTTWGDTTGATADVALACAFEIGAPDRTYRLDVPALTQLDVALDTSSSSFATNFLDVAVYDATCGGTAKACTNLPPTSLTNVTAGTYYITVAGDTSTLAGPYALTVHGTIVPGGSCEGPLVTSGLLDCGATGACTGTVGSRTCKLAQCADGIDNDADGKKDYPNDPGCTAPGDDSEGSDDCFKAHAAQTACPVCGNGIDDDGDTLIDYPTDFGCVSASGTTEVFCGTIERDPVKSITAFATNGTNTAMHDDFQSANCGLTGGLDVAYALVLPVPVDTLSIDTNNAGFSTVLSFHDSTCALETTCAGAFTGSGSGSLMTVTGVAAGVYAIVVDGDSSTDTGNFALHVNGVVPAGTVCTSPLFAAGVLACPSPQNCTLGKCQ